MLNFLRNLKEQIYGNSGQYIMDALIDFSHFGILTMVLLW